MKALINYANQAYEAHHTGQPGPHIARGIGLAIGLAGMQTVQSICQHHFFYRSMMTGAMARTALVNVIYRKSLVLSNKVFALRSPLR
jgi:ATP-binding cassette, subfamily C (CFTR/MRP), member 1